MRRFLISWLAVVCTVPLPAQESSQLSRSAQKWVRSTMAGMSIEDKAAQLVMVRAFGQYQSPRSENHQRLLSEIRDLRVGGVVVFESDLESIPPLLNALQDAAPVPLLVAADLERGLGKRVCTGFFFPRFLNHPSFFVNFG